MKRITLGLLLLGSLAACVQFRPISLYEAEATEPKPSRPDDISLLVETKIYHDDTLNVWGVMNEPGKKSHLSKEIKKAGEASIYISWDRSKCDWAGFGAGWDDWVGKDLTGVRDYAALQFYVRTEKGKSFGLPMVVSLEDYSGKSGYAYAANKYFERYAIDEEFQRVLIPLTAFDVNEFGLDLSNIKQIQFELQQSGSIYIDEIELVPYEAKPEKPWIVEETLPDPLTMPKVLFDDAFINNNGFGLMDYGCQKINLTSKETHSGSQAIEVEWDDQPGKCGSIGFGLSWYKWRPFDITPILPNAAIEFYLKVEKGAGATPAITLMLQDYTQTPTSLPLNTKYVEGGQFSGEWQKVRCPLADFQGNWNSANMKGLFFSLKGAGKVYVDDIRLVSN